MRLYRPLMLLCPIVLIAACSNPEGAAPAAPPANEAATTTQPIATPEATEATAAGMSDSNVAAMGGAMTAMMEFCGLTGDTTRAQTIASMQKDMTAQGMSAVEVERMFNQGYEETKAKAASDPDAARADCGALKQMADPAEIKKWEKAAEEMKARAKAQGV